MPPFFKVIGWSLLGALIGGAVTFAGFLVVQRDVLFGPHDAGGVQTWTWFVATRGGMAGALLGFVLGAISGIARVFGGDGPRIKPTE